MKIILKVNAKLMMAFGLSQVEWNILQDWPVEAGFIA